MVTPFSPRPVQIHGGTESLKDEVYNLSGLNMVTPDELIDTATRRFNRQYLGQSPYTINSRMLSRDADQQRFAIGTRKGNSNFFGLENTTDTPLTVQNVAAQTGEVMFSATQSVASPIAVGVSALGYGFYCFGLIDLKIRKTAGAIEAINIQICRDNAGIPGTVIATSSFDLNSVTTSITTVRAKFIDAPSLNSAGETLWMVLSLTNAPTAQCFVQTSAASTGLKMNTATTGNPWVAAGANSFVLYAAPCYRSGMVLGAHRRVVTGETPTTIVATGYGNLIKFDNTLTNGLVYSYAPGYNVTSHKFRFNQQDNWSIFVNGVIQPSYWDNTSVTTLSNAPATATHVLSWKNRLFMVVGNKVSFTDLLTTLANANSWPAVNYFYPNTPNDPDYITAAIIFQDNMIVFTKETKYIVRMTGAGISSITITQVRGSKGAISQECVATDGNYVYFIASDYRMYRFNGVSDSLISDNVEPEIRAAQTPELLSSLQVHNNIVRYRYARTPSAQVDRTLIYDVTHAEWFLDTGRPIAFSIQHNLEDHRIVEFSSNTTLAMLGDTNYSDMGKPIDFKYWTNYKAYGSGAAKKRVRRFRPIIKAFGTPFYIKVGKDIDFQNTPDLRDYLVSAAGHTFGDGHVFGDGSVFGGSSMVNGPAGMSGRGKHVQYRFEKNGVNTLTMIYGYIALYKRGRNK